MERGDERRAHAFRLVRGFIRFVEAGRPRLTPYGAGAVSVAALLAGVLVWFAMYRADRQLRGTLLAQAQIASAAIDPHRVASLAGTTADTSSADYARLKRQLMRLRRANPSCRFLYLMRRAPGGSVVFLVDSEPPGSPDESPPGQPYPEASGRLLRVFAEGVGITEGPSSDRWGTWVTAAVPVRDESGQTVAVLGIDEDARGWRRRVALSGALPSVFVVLGTGIALLALRLRRVNRRIQESQRTLGAIFRSSPTGMGVVVDRRFVEVNDRLCAMLGYAREELLGRSARMIYESDEEFERVGREKYAQIRETGVGSIQTRFRRKDGAVIDVLLSSAAMDPADFASPVVFAALDVSERVKREEELRREQRFSRLLLDASPAFIVAISPEGTTLAMNRAMLEAVEYGPEEVEGTDYLATFVPPEDRPALAEVFHCLVVCREPTVNENRIVSRSGAIRLVEWHGRPVLDEEGRARFFIGVGIDITARRKTEEDLRVQARYFEELFDGAPEAIAIVDNDDVVQRINRAFTRLFGYEPGEAVGRKINDLIVPEDLAEEGSSATAAVARGQRVSFESVRCDKDGRRIEVSVEGTPVTLDEAQLGVYAIYRDIGERRRAERFLRESEERYRTIVESMGEGLLQVDHEDRILFVNEQFCRLVGRSRGELVGKIGYELFAADEAGRALIREKNLLRQRNVADCYETTIRRADGVDVPVMVSGAPVRGPDGVILGSVGLITDLTEIRRAEQERAQLQERWLQAQKMEAVGRLAGGIAHDFNNMLQVILGHVEMALGRVMDDALRHDLEEVRAAARRSAELTRQLLGFARRQTARPRVVDMNEVVEGMLGMLRRLIGEDITLHWRPGAVLRPVRIDPVQVDQILANLSVNARDAMERGGILQIETRNDGDQVVIAVRDTGVGMTDEVKRHLFEPFFTTKGVGEGTGLGLATVKGIVEQNGGRVEVDSRVGEGTEVRVYLPACEAPHASLRREEAPACGRGKGELVLVVEDEPAILRMVTRMGEALGYRILSASSAEEAGLLARQQAIAVVVTDVVMPGRSGREVLEAVRQARPAVKVVYMSGYPADEAVRRGIERGAVFVRKPFTMDELGKKIEEALRE